MGIVIPMRGRMAPITTESSMILIRRFTIYKTMPSLCLLCRQSIFNANFMTFSTGADGSSVSILLTTLLVGAGLKPSMVSACMASSITSLFIVATPVFLPPPCGIEASAAQVHNDALCRLGTDTLNLSEHLGIAAGNDVTEFLGT